MVWFWSLFWFWCCQFSKVSIHQCQSCSVGLWFLLRWSWQCARDLFGCSAWCSWDRWACLGSSSCWTCLSCPGVCGWGCQVGFCCCCYSAHPWWFGRPLGLSATALSSVLLIFVMMAGSTLSSMPFVLGLYASFVCASPIISSVFDLILKWTLINLSWVFLVL